MGTIDIIKPLSTVLSSAFINSQQHQEKIIEPQAARREASILPRSYAALASNQECFALKFIGDET